MHKRRNRQSRLWIVWLAGLSTIASRTALVEASQVAFQPAATGAPMLKRQATCAANYYGCANQGAAWSNICCQMGQVCSADVNNNPACCPATAVCTGTAPTPVVTAAANTGVSYVPNAYFSFPYMPNSFANTGACLSAVNQCSANYAACTSGLQAGDGGGNGAGGYGVTVVVPGGGGVTVAPSQTTLGSSSALSICSSLSSAACPDGQSSLCTVGTAAGGGFVVGNAGAPRPTGDCQLAGAVAAGVGLGMLVGL